MVHYTDYADAARLVTAMLSSNCVPNAPDADILTLILQASRDLPFAFVVRKVKAHVDRITQPSEDEGGGAPALSPRGIFGNAACDVLAGEAARRIQASALQVADVQCRDKLARRVLARLAAIEIECCKATERLRAAELAAAQWGSTALGRSRKHKTQDKAP